MILRDCRSDSILTPESRRAWEIYVTVWEKPVTFFQDCPPATDHAHEVLSRIARKDDMDNIRNYPTRGLA